MKKIISLLIIISMMVLSLASCDLVDKALENMGKEPSGSNDATDKAVYTITEENWAALGTITNYTVNLYITSTVVKGDESAVIKAKSVYKSSDDAIYEKVTPISHSNENIGIYIVSSESYYMINNGKRCLVSQNQDGKWTATESDWNIDSLLEFFSFSEEIEFSSLIYDDNLKAYTYTYEEGKTVYTINYYFKNGTLTRIYGKADYYHGEGDSESEIVDANISNIGVTHVVIPQLVQNDFNSSQNP